MPFKLSDLKEHNSELLKLLTQQLPDMLWVKDLNGKYLYANKAICDGLLMAKDTDEPIGKGDVFFALREREANSDKLNWHTFGELCFNSDQVVIENGEAMKFEEYGNVKGELLYLEVYKAPFYDEDGKTIGTVGAGRDITNLKKTQLDLEKNLKILDEQREQLEYQANHDSLTDLPNRVLFMDRLQQSINIAQRYDNKVALLFIDLDHFKEINDSLGHGVGDKVLIEVSRRMKNQMRKSDTLSRLGGDEFCIILNDIIDIEDMSDIITSGMEALKEPMEINGHTLYVGMSIGVSVYPNDGNSASSLLKNADAAMYKAKGDGRNTYCFYDEAMTERAFERVFLETALRKALEEDELVVYFQPQIDARENKLVGMEALVRWEHPIMGFIYPDKFIPLAEITGMIVQLDRLVMKKALTQFKKWDKAGLNPGKLALNLAIKQIEENDFIEFIENILDCEDCSYKNIEFELTENQIMNNPEASIETLQKLSDLGISIAIDDFGTGYSSLAYLKRLPIDKLKIDRSFIKDLPQDADDAAITKTIISLCSSLNLKVIAEGVETEKQKNFILQNGCQFIQGYYYSRPLSIEDMTKYLIEHNKTI
ncbi:diguanylate cyclase/phosphodiesterase [Sulfurimonas gotlandica GD1]|uniref:Diguanylate cyclase/phosphodiesterase n=1 Tax=Sulfurimonas gotlandica (strain DSM 19862 / JCM 16533 / GD1) TaxID=929558 RepID=B6BGZ6_SULGG|nr:GGDEF and EAL domain-containing protein [Sulfurimonas gotlandica]EDZ63805.1 diguanylate cyclase/phosphodiesterase [Sulfurimonas gotlandica GD1]EHP29780.1 diguanylate cyclase/phosphodiesterase [Sulfurimonas gotlandica GD1]